MIRTNVIAIAFNYAVHIAIEVRLTTSDSIINYCRSRLRTFYFELAFIVIRAFITFYELKLHYSVVNCVRILREMKWARIILVKIIII